MYFYRELHLQSSRREISVYLSIYGCCCEVSFRAMIYIYYTLTNS